MSLLSTDVRHPLATKQGWASFVAQISQEPPRLLPAEDWKRLTPFERDLYDEARQDYHSALLLVATPDTRDSPQSIAHTVASVMRRVGTGMVLVDEIHRLDLTTRQGKNASDQLKYFFDTISATFVYAGLDLDENGMFSGVRGRQIAGRLSRSTPARSPTAPRRTSRTGPSWSPRWNTRYGCTVTSPAAWSSRPATCTTAPAA